MRKLLAMALLGVGAVFFAANAPAQAMTAGSAGVTKSAAGAESQVIDVRRRWHRHRGHRWHGHRHHRRWGHRRFYAPYYYGGYGGYYGYPYYYRRRPGIGLYFRF
jgi:hypothetical protein